MFYTYWPHDFKFMTCFKFLNVLNKNQHVRWQVNETKLTWIYTYEPPHDKTYKMACASSEDSDQSGHPPSLIRVFAVRVRKVWVLSYPLSTQQRLWSNCWADAQADLSLHWVHSHFVGFVMRRLILWVSHKHAWLNGKLEKKWIHLSRSMIYPKCS